jgi:uncharacterized spore protein YtfJ
MEADRVTDEIRKIGERASVKAAFGEPETYGERTIIPVAGVMYGYGMGYGQEITAKEGEPSGSGGGGGGGGWTSPYGVLEITPRGVKFINTVDSNKLGMMGIAMAAWNVFWIAYTIRKIAARRQRMSMPKLAMPNLEMPVDKKMIKAMIKQARAAKKKASWMPFMGK